MNELVAITAAPSNLVGMVADARTALANASGAAEILDTIDKADFAYEAARLSRAKDAHDEINASMNRVQADALEILALAKRRLADEYDAAQSRGEIATKGGDRKSIKVLDENFDPKPATVADIGLTKTEVFEARQVRDAIEAQPDLLRSVLDEMLESGEEPTKARLKKALAPTITRLRADATAAKKERRVEREIALGQKIRALPAKKFGVIWADPEWRFEPYSRETGMDRAPDNHYPTSETDDICARDVGSIAADDCVLFLWATAPMLLDAIRVMEAWGFGYKTNVVWVKERMGDAGGTGYWFLNDHEHLLVGTRGNAVAPAMGEQWRSVITARVGEHSAKPEIFLEMVEDYFPNLPKIELNRRGAARPGWDAWGFEADLPEAGQIDEIDLSGEGPTATPPEGALEAADPARPFDQLQDSVPDINGKPVKAGDFVRATAADASAEPFEVRRVYKNGGVSVSNATGHQVVLKAGQFEATEAPAAVVEITRDLYDRAATFMSTKNVMGLVPNIQDVRKEYGLDYDTAAKLFDAVIDGKRPEAAKSAKTKKLHVPSQRGWAESPKAYDLERKKSAERRASYRLMLSIHADSDEALIAKAREDLVAYDLAVREADIEGQCIAADRLEAIAEIAFGIAPDFDWTASAGTPPKGSGRFSCLSDAYQWAVSHHPLPAGKIPMFGQPARLVLDVAGCRVDFRYDGMFGICGGDAHVIDLDKPFFSNTGYHSFQVCPHDKIIHAGGLDCKAWLERVCMAQLTEGGKKKVKLYDGPFGLNMGQGRDDTSIRADRKTDPAFQPGGHLYEPATIDIEEWIESKAAPAIPAPTEDELIEFKMLGAIEAGLVVGGDMFDAFVERGLVFTAGKIELSFDGSDRLAALERMVKAHSDGDAVRCAPAEGGAAC